jgi:uncharacterized small protein (TIGR04563 family)
MPDTADKNAKKRAASMDDGDDDRRAGGGGNQSDKRKQSLYFPEDMLLEIQAEANRQDRSLSWIVQKAWKIARKEIMKFPSVEAESE